MTASRERAILIAIVAAAVGLRLVRLGSLSFAGDEETTALAALALLEGWPPTLAGGEIYLRGLPFTWLEAGMAAAFGASEWSLRLVPVLLAGARVALIWWMARPLLGASTALASAALLAVAPLDVELSRTARMYSLFATLDLAFLAAVIRASAGLGRWKLAGATGVLSVITPSLGVTHAPVPWAAAAAPELGRRARVGLVALGGALFASYALMQRVHGAAAGPKGVQFEGVASAASPVQAHLERIASILESPWAAAVVAAGLLLAIVVGARGVMAQRTPAGRVAAVAALAGFAGASPVIGAILLLGLAVLERVPIREAPERAAGVWVAGAIATVAWGCGGLFQMGLASAGIEAAARLLLGLPAPNWADLVHAAPLFCAVAAVGVVVAFDRAAREERSAPWLALIAGALGPLILTGLVARRAGIRYHLHELAPMIVLALVALRPALGRLVPHRRAAFAVAVALVALALRPDHSLRALLRQHGPVTSPYVVLGVAPDHRGAAEFVRERLKAQEWVVAEDALQQHLLVGRVDLWLRRQEDAGRFLRPALVGELPRDRYTGARYVADLDALRALAASEEQRVVWLITSGECEAKPEFYRTAETVRRLEEWRPLAWYTGDDGMTRVYRLEDGLPVPPPASR